MKDIGNYKLSKVRDALARLDQALGRLETAAETAPGSAAVKAELDALSQNHAALKKTAGHVAVRLDAVLDRLGAQLKT